MLWLFLLGILALYGLVRLVDDLYRTRIRSRSPSGPTLLVHVYNQEDTVEDLVRRLLAATPDLQLVVADGGSTDGTRAILARLALTHGFRLAADADPCPCRPPGPVWCLDARPSGKTTGNFANPLLPISVQLYDKGKISRQTMENLASPSVPSEQSFTTKFPGKPARRPLFRWFAALGTRR